jgi:hypothetical protein
MSLNSNREYRDDLKRILKENKMWVKNPAAGRLSLMRAISNAIYFTETRHQEIHRMISTRLHFFLKNHPFRFSKMSDSETLQRFLSNPDLPEFTNMNLEIISTIFKKRFKLFYIEKNTLCSEIFYKKTRNYCSIFRFSENTFAASFDLGFKMSAIFAQDVVLSIVDSLMTGDKFFPKNANKGHFINFEYENQGMSIDSPLKFFDFSFNDSIISTEERENLKIISSSKFSSFDYKNYTNAQISELLATNKQSKAECQTKKLEKLKLIKIKNVDFRDHKSKKIVEFSRKVVEENRGIHQKIPSKVFQNLFKSFPLLRRENLEPSNPKCAINKKEEKQSIIPIDQRSAIDSEKSNIAELPDDILESHHSSNRFNGKSPHIILKNQTSLLEQSNNVGNKNSSRNNWNVYENEEINVFQTISSKKSSNLNRKTILDKAFGLPKYSKNQKFEKEGIFSKGILSYYDNTKGFGIIEVDQKNPDDCTHIYVFRNELEASGIDVISLENKIQKKSLRIQFKTDPANKTRLYKLQARNVRFLETQK